MRQVAEEPYPVKLIPFIQYPYCPGQDLVKVLFESRLNTARIISYIFQRLEGPRFFTVPLKRIAER